MAQTRTRYCVDLPAEHARCETNYARVQRLLPDLAHNGQQVIGLPSVGKTPACVRFCVTDRSVYTTSLDVFVEQTSPTAISGTPLPFVVTPRLTFNLRLYHDAAMAEVVGFQQASRPAPRQAYPNPRMLQPDEKAQWNRFFGDWLAYCLSYGHSLSHMDFTSFGESTS